MKRFLRGLLISLVSIGFMVNGYAMEYSEYFEIGDSVTVSFDNEVTKYGFHVLKGSASGEQNVLLLMDGTVAVHDAAGNIINGQVVYNLPDATGDASIFEGSNAQTMLKKAVNELNWVVVGSPRFLETSDFDVLGISKDNDGTYTIPVKYDFLAPHSFDSAPTAQTTSYWTQIAKDTNNVYAVVSDGADKNAGVSAKVIAYNVDPVTSDNKFSMRPVVLVDKKYVLCNNSRVTTPTPEGPETGVSDYVLILTGIGLVSVILYVSMKKRNVFQEI